MGDGLFNKFKILIGVEDTEEEREVPNVSAPVSAVPDAGGRREPSLPIRNGIRIHSFSLGWIIGKIRW